MHMKKHRVILSSVLLVLALGTSASQFAQDASTGVENSGQQSRNHVLALGFLRTINTAEVADFSKYGSYASWQTLLVHQPEYLNAWLSTYYPQKPNVHFGDLPDILPGLHLRLSVHTDGHGYDVLVEDAGDKNGYAGLSDESGRIRECKWLR
jgi:hypothetical protein